MSRPAANAVRVACIALFPSFALAQGDLFPGPTLRTGQQVRWQAAADFDDDGLDDLAFVSSTAQQLTVYLGNGDLTFPARVDYALGFHPLKFEVADVNGDGREDLVLVNGAKPFVTETSGLVAVYFGAAEGSFVKGPEKTLTVVPLSMGSGDVNNDGVLDLVVGDKRFVVGTGYSNLVASVLGTGNGGFGQEIPTIAALRPIDVALADAGGDGKADLFVLTSFESIPFTVRALRVLWGLGDGHFHLAATQLDLPAIPSAMRITELNGDSDPDVLVGVEPVGGATNGQVLFCLGESSHSMILTQSLDVPLGTPWSIERLDYDDDALGDLIVSGTSGLTYGAPGRVAFLRGKRGNEFTVDLVLETGSSWANVFRDFDFDGWRDLVTLDTVGSGPAVWRGLTSGPDGAPAFETFGVVTLTSPAPPPPDQTPSTVAIRTPDLDGDGIADLVTATDLTLFAGDVGSYLCMARGFGDGSFEAPSASSLPFKPHSLEAADVNNDGVVDVVCVGIPFLDAPVPYGLQIVLGDGRGGVASSTEYELDGIKFGLDVGDGNGDGWLDVFITSGAPPGKRPAGAVLRFDGVGRGVVALGASLDFDAYLGDIAAGDLDDDGDADFVVATDAGLRAGYSEPPRHHVLRTMTTAFAPLATELLLVDVSFDVALDVAGGSAFPVEGVFTVTAADDGSPVVREAPPAGEVAGCSLADLDQDGILDFVVGENSPLSSLVVQRGKPDGNYERREDYYAGYAPWCVRAADVNQDGYPDALLGGFGWGAVKVFLNRLGK